MSDLFGKRRTRRQTLLLFVGGGAASVLAAACSPIAPSNPTAAAAKPALTAAPSATSAAPAPASAGQPAPAASPVAAANAPTPRAGGTLQYGRVADIGSTDGHDTGQANFVLLSQVYDTLTAYDAKLTPQPALAESWDLSSDAKQLKLNLRKGVQFHSGREFAANDVRYNLMRVRDPKVNAQVLPMSGWITDIQTPDMYTVVLTFDAPRPAIFDMLEWICMVDQATVEGPSAANTANGTGPFKFAEWVPGNHVRFTRNPNYWVSGRPYLDEVNVQVIKDPQSLLVQLESGAIQMVEAAPERDVARYEKTPGYQVSLSDQGTDVYYLAANCTKPPFTDKRVRQAVNYALDRQRFLDTTLSGVGEVSDLPWATSSPAYDPAKSKLYNHDLDKAKSLFQQAGVSNVELSLVTNGGNPPLADQAQQLQADLAQIGIKLNVQNLPIPAWRDQFFNASYQGLLSGPFGPANLHPASLFLMARPFFTSGVVTGFKSDAFTQLVQAASTEPDATKQKQFLDQLNDLLLDESFVMPTVRQRPNLVLGARVHDARRRLNNTVVLRDAWVDA